MSFSAPRSAAELAKAALKRLMLDQLEPTPENYARAYAQETGRPLPPAQPMPPPVPLADWIERVVRGLERGGKHWTTARKKESLQRMLDGSRADVQRLQQRLGPLLSHWERDHPDGSPADFDDEAAVAAGAAEASSPALREADAASVAPLQTLPAKGVAGKQGGATEDGDERDTWNRLVERLGASVRVALPSRDTLAEAISADLAAITRRLRQQGAGATQADELSELCGRADLLLQHRQHLTAQLAALCEELTGSLTDLAEDDSWAQGQCDAMRLKIQEGLTARGVKSVTELLRTTRARQGQLRHDREQARDALKAFIHQMLGELGELGQQTGRFHDSVGRYAEVIERADTLESLAGAVREMVVESRTVESLVGQAQQRLRDEHARATALGERVAALENELRRLSDEVSTDQLTQVANRRGLFAAFEVERARQARSGGMLCVALLDVDNFKRLNDELGHSAGDEALKALAARVAQTLRPTDHVARYGGEEFVLLLPDTAVAEAQEVLTRLQRALTGGLFMHEDRPVLVTFSAGVTALREMENLEDALNRADQALYEAKRSGKNRSCAA